MPICSVLTHPLKYCLRVGVGAYGQQHAVITGLPPLCNDSSHGRVVSATVQTGTKIHPVFSSSALSPFTTMISLFSCLTIICSLTVPQVHKDSFDRGTCQPCNCLVSFEPRDLSTHDCLPQNYRLLQTPAIETPRVFFFLLFFRGGKVSSVISHFNES